MIDFDALVLAPCMNTFAIPIKINPIVSRPGVAPYDARGVWEVQPYTVIMEDGAPMNTSIYKLGLRMAEFLVPPDAGDHALIPRKENPLIVDEFALDAKEIDGQGGVKWTVKAIALVPGATP